MLPIVALSGFINDTPLVVVTLHIVLQWTRKFAIAALPLDPAVFCGTLGWCLLFNWDFDQSCHLGFAAGPDCQYGVPVALVGIAHVGDYLVVGAEPPCLR